MSIPNKFNPFGTSNKPYLRKLEYLESTGTQWIDTGIVLGSTDTGRYVLNICITEKKYGDYVPIGTLNDNFGIGYYHSCWSCSYRLGLGGSYTDSQQVEVGKWYALDLTNGLFKINGVEHSFTQVTGWSNNKSVYLFVGHNSNNTRYGLTTCRISYAKIYNGNNLLGYFIPVLDLNNVSCLYDKVSKTLFYNQGTGQFSYG